MVFSIIMALIFTLIAIIIRHVIKQDKFEKITASWMSFVLAVLATAICTLIAGEPQGTVISGFVTMLLCYNVLIR